MAMKSAVIIGASSGIGAALAEELAARGWQLGLAARRTERLQDIAETLRQRHDRHTVTATLDIREEASVAPTLDGLAAALGGRIDLVIVNAGVSGWRRAGDGRLDIDRNVIETNLLGAIAAIDAATALFIRQGGGHLVGISSLTALRGMPGIAAYTASKAALSNYLEAVGTELAPKGIRVTTVHPGFVNTDFAPGMEKYPFVATPARVAREIADAIAQGRRSVTVPRWPWAAVAPLLRVAPDSLLRRFFR